MSLWKCNACGGTYSDTLKDGTVYFHECPMTPPNAQGVQTELPNKRNENIGPPSIGAHLDIIAPGAGVTPMQGQTTTDPAWLAALRTGPVVKALV